MEIKHIKELMAAMGRTGTKRLMIKRDGFELQLEREENGTYKALDPLLESDEALRSDSLLPRSPLALGKGKEMPSAPNAPLVPPSSEQEETPGVYVTSPMVGTFYSSPSPDDPPFAKVGDKIEKQTVICIIEAMKVMNEVKAGVSGTIAEVLVESGHPVEFGTKLFKII